MPPLCCRRLDPDEDSPCSLQSDIELRLTSLLDLLKKIATLEQRIYSNPVYMNLAQNTSEFSIRLSHLASQVWRAVDMASICNYDSELAVLLHSYHFLLSSINTVLHESVEVDIASIDTDYLEPFYNDHKRILEKQLKKIPDVVTTYHMFQGASNFVVSGNQFIHQSNTNQDQLNKILQRQNYLIAVVLF